LCISQLANSFSNHYAISIFLLRRIDIELSLKSIEETLNGVGAICSESHQLLFGTPRGKTHHWFNSYTDRTGFVLVLICPAPVVLKGHGAHADPIRNFHAALRPACCGRVAPSSSTISPSVSCCCRPAYADHRPAAAAGAGASASATEAARNRGGVVIGRASLQRISCGWAPSAAGRPRETPALRPSSRDGCALVERASCRAHSWIEPETPVARPLSREPACPYPLDRMSIPWPVGRGPSCGPSRCAAGSAGGATAVVIVFPTGFRCAVLVERP